MKKFVVSFLLSLVVLSLLYTTVGEDLLNKNKPIGTDPNEVIEVDDDGEQEYVEEEGNEIKQEYKDELLFVVFGVDGNGVKREKGLRSDVIIVSKVNFDSGEVDMLQIHRDSRVSVQGSMDKINAAHSYGGPKLAMRTIRDYLGIDVDYYVKVDFKGIMDIVDAVGGVEFDVPVNMKYNDPTAKPPLNINLKKGLQHLDGKKSHDLLRFRHNNGTDYYPGGFTREQVQLDWIKVFIKTVVQPKNILKLPHIIKKTYDSVDTNIPLNLILAAAASAGKIDTENMNMQSIPGEGYIIKSGGWFYFPNEKEKERLVNEMFGDYLLKR